MSMTAFALIIKMQDTKVLGKAWIYHLNMTKSLIDQT